MFRPAVALLLLVAVLLTSCSQNTRTELEDTAYWNARFIDSSFCLLHEDKNATRALRYFDSALKQSDEVTVYPKAVHFGLIASYYYFFTSDNEATSKMIDSALAIYKMANLQDRYSRTYVGYLLLSGQIAYLLSQYNKANDYYFKAKMLGESHLTPCERKAFSYSIAMVLYRQQNYSASLQYFKEAYALQATCSPQTTAVVLQQQEIQSNIGLCHVQLKNYDSAMVHFDKALQIANQYKDSLGPATIDKIYGVVYGNMAKVFIAQNRVNEAKQLSKKV